MLKVSNIRKIINGKTIIDDISFNINLEISTDYLVLMVLAKQLPFIQLRD